MSSFAEEIAREKLLERATLYEDLVIANSQDHKVKKKHWREIEKLINK